MRLDDRLHLTYCSNIHAGEHWADVSAALATALPAIRQHLNHHGPFGIGLRLAASAARTLDDAATFDRFREFLRAGRYYVPTINGFPYGAFHGARVKQRVYEPDWRQPARLDYSNRLAQLQATLAVDARLDRASISTVPGAFRENVTTDDDVAAIVAALLAHAAYLKQLYERTGVTVTLAIEAEPACFIETTAEAIAFFRDHLLNHRALAAASAQTGVSLAADDVLRHVGLCLDACHMAVEFEDAAEALREVRAAGICIAKVQLSAALQVIETESATTPQVLLAPFSEDTYLHQVVISTANGLERHTDLPEALHARASDARADREWRVHFHVPIFLAEMSGFQTTQAYLANLLQLLKTQQISTCLEVETYTWDVLPPQYRTTDVCTAIARELTWVRDQLAG